MSDFIPARNITRTIKARNESLRVSDEKHDNMIKPYESLNNIYVKNESLIFRNEIIDINHNAIYGN